MPGGDFDPDGKSRRSVRSGCSIVVPGGAGADCIGSNSRDLAEFREPQLLEQLEDLLLVGEVDEDYFARPLASICVHWPSGCLPSPWFYHDFNCFPRWDFSPTSCWTPLVTGVLWIGYFILLVGNCPLPYSTELLSIPENSCVGGWRGWRNASGSFSTIPEDMRISPDLMRGGCGDIISG